MKTIEKIISKDNARVKAARAVRDGRDGTAIFIEGVRLAEEACRSEIELIECFADGKFGESERQQRLLETLRERRVPVHACSDAAFRSMTDTATSQGVVIVAKRPMVTFDLAIVSQPLFIYLHEISDPSNLGAVIRSAEAAGVDGIYLSVGSADPYSPRSIRASMGSAFRTRIERNVDLKILSRQMRESGIITVGAALGGTQSYSQTDWIVPIMLVMGSEASGLPDEIVSLLDRTIYIPMRNDVESLNLAVSTGILVFEARRVRDMANASEPR